MSYEEDVTKILAAAISTLSSNKLSKWLTQGKVNLKLEMDCKMLKDIESF